jgi:signal transduction histidine kinase
VYFVNPADQGTAVDMAINNPNGINEREESWRVADMLRDCFLCGVILVHSRDQSVILGGDAAQILGWETDSKEPRPIASLPEPLRTLTRELASSSSKPVECTVELNVPDRGAFPVRITPLPMSLAGETVKLALLVRGLSLQPQFELRLQKLARLAAIGTLSASMAHEIKNALVASKTFIDLLLEKNQDAELVEVVRREIGRIDSMVNQTLSFAKADKKRFTSLRLHEVLANALRLVEPQLGTRSIALRRSFEAEPDVVRGDDHQLQQAFLNLFLNASEAMADHGTLSVATENVQRTPAGPSPRTSAPPNQLRVTISDTGPGMAPETMARLFEPFYTTKPNGTGLGLPIVWRIIQDHRGSISVDSQPGQGTTFRVLLPVLPAPDRPLHAPLHARRPQ